MTKKLTRLWPILRILITLLIVLNPVAVISRFCLPFVSMGILGCPTAHRPRFTVSRASNGQLVINFDKYTWNAGDQFFFPIEITNCSVKRADKEAWTIKCLSRSNFRLEALEYGKVPTGWIETRPAKVIIAGNYYTINNGDFFTKTETGNYEHLSRDEYFYKAQHHQLYKEF